MRPRSLFGLLKGVAQKTEIIVDGNGIRADSGSVFTSIAAGMMTVPIPFRMFLGRPFIHLVRDAVTRALLFAGVVMNPNQQQTAC